MSAPRNRRSTGRCRRRREIVAVLGGEQQDELVLRRVGVLVLVDQDVLEALLVVREHVGVLAEQRDGVHEQVVEVHRAGLLQAGLVLGVDVGDLALEDVATPWPTASPGSTSSFFRRLIVACTPRGGNRLGSRPRSRMT